MEYFEIDEKSGYHLNLVSPLLIELGRKVNLRYCFNLFDLIKDYKNDFFQKSSHFS